MCVFVSISNIETMYHYPHNYHKNYKRIDVLSVTLFQSNIEKKVCLISNQDECEGGDLTTMLNFALDFKSCLILKNTFRKNRYTCPP